MVVGVMAIAAALIYWVIVAIWLAVLGTVCWNYARNARTFGTTRLLLGVIAIDTTRNIVENVYFGLYFDSLYGFFAPAVGAVLGQPLLLIMPKVLNVVSGVLVLSILLLRWLPGAIGERRGVEERNAHLSRMAAIDGMTGLFNRSHFLFMAETEFVRAQRYQHPMAVVLLDIDRFKSINDSYGHDIGDRVIVEIANILRSMAREADMAARLGGEEFVVMLPETGVNEAGILAERLRAAISASPITVLGSTILFSASIGVSGRKGCSTLGEMLKQSDLALYKAKESGRNRVCLATGDGTAKDDGLRVLATPPHAA
jgi:diguanylate cyclase (GGDEF)-like protein